MEQVKNTAEQLADRFMDLRAIENTMGRYVNSLLLKQEDTILHDYWSRFENDICYGTNEGWYTGRRAVREYYEAMHRNTEIRSKLVQKLFPDFLGDKTDEEIHGVGALIVDAIATPVIELSGYGTTAKGVWLFVNATHEILECGPYSILETGYYAVDFTKEGTEWKIWHMQRIVETRCPQEVNWADDWKLPSPLAEFESLKGLSLPAPNRLGLAREIYRKGRKPQEKVRLPEPYYDWDDTFSYGPDMPEYKRAGMDIEM